MLVLQATCVRCVAVHSVYTTGHLMCAAGYLHQVRSYGRSISLTVKFAPSTSFDDNGCKLIEEEFLPLTEASFTWTFTEGRRVGTHNIAKSV